MTGRNHVATCLEAMATCGAAYCRFQAGNAGLSRAVASYAGFWSGAGGTGAVPVDLGCAAAFAVLGSLLPDVDSRSSVLGRHVRLPFGHRTWTHSVWALVMVAVACAYVPLPGMYGLLFGYMAHLVMDSFSSMGVCWLYPFTRYVYMDHGTWKKGSGGHGPKVAQNHRLRLYRTGRPDPGRKFTVTDGRTKRRWLTDDAAASAFGLLCAVVCAACAASLLT